MKIADVTQFYAPRSGGVKRYLHEKISYIQNATQHEHVLIVPGARDEFISAKRSRIYFVKSPLVSRSGGYRAFVNLRRLEEILGNERPDLIECADPYQLAWKTIAVGRRLRRPVIGFYHSHFADAYVRHASRLIGRRATDVLINLAAEYTSSLYNSFAKTLVSSEWLARVLREWGISDIEVVSLGINADIFCQENDAAQTRAQLGLNPSRRLLLYVGRLAPEKNTRTLFGAFEILRQRLPSTYQLLVIGDGPERSMIRDSPDVTWVNYCAEPEQLARYYRAADLFVQPSMQETFGLAALESQACGMPVIGIRDSEMIILHERDFWAETNTAEALADAIESAWNRDLKKIGESAAKAAKSYSWRHVFEQLFSIYDRVYNDAVKGR